MFLAIARILNLENFRDIPLRPCGTSRYSKEEIAEAFIAVLVFYTYLNPTFTESARKVRQRESLLPTPVSLVACPFK